MKRLIVTIISIFIILFLSACSNQNSDLVVMTYEIGDEYTAIVWDDNIYIPHEYGVISRSDCGKQIGFIDGNENDKIYEFKGYATDEWIISALPYDAPMLWREVNITNLPEGWQSEYEWNNLSTENALEETALNEPPELAIISNDTSCNALLGTYSWQRLNGDGTATNMEADSAHPLDCKDLLLPLETTETTATLSFYDEPDAILSVQCWSDEYWSDPTADSEVVTVNGNEIELKPGGYIYEVKAEWNTENGYGGGIAYYSFYLKTAENDNENTITFTGTIIDNVIDTLTPTISIKSLENEFPYEAVFFELPDDEADWVLRIGAVVTVTCKDSFSEGFFGTLISIEDATIDNSAIHFTEEQIEEAKEIAFEHYADMVFIVSSIEYLKENHYVNDIDCCNFIVRVSAKGDAQPDRTISLQLDNGVWEIVNEWQ